MEEKEVELWTFGGSRVGSDGKRLHAWVDPKGTHLFYKASGSYSVGSVYKVTVRRDGNKVTMYGKPVYSGQRTDNADLTDQLAAKHRAAEVTLSMKARERADKRNDPVEEAIDRLVELAGHVPSSQRVAFSAYVMQKLMRAWAKS